MNVSSQPADNQDIQAAGKRAAFDFQLSQPSGQLAAMVQGIWSVSVSQVERVVKPLHSDAASGIIFNLAGHITIGNTELPEGVIMLPVNKQSENIVLSGGAQLAGIRFHPAIGYGILGKHYSDSTLLSPQDDHMYQLYEVYTELQRKPGGSDQIQVLYQWAESHLDFTHVIPDSLERALNCIDDDEAPGQLSKHIALSQRQIERLFKRWLGMTPKHYQRILRIKKAICFLRQHRNACLATVAQQFGFSDQAHMTREFRSIACITPGQV